MIATSIAAAQSTSLPGDIEANVREHLRFISAAHGAGVQMLVFPELSLTGYELPLLQRCLLHPGDDVLAPLRALVRQTGIVVTVGAPVAPVDASSNALPAIGAITYLPDGSHTVYRKAHRAATYQPGKAPFGHPTENWWWQHPARAPGW